MMKKCFQFLLLLLAACHGHAQKITGIDEKEVLRIESTLAADNMRGRRAGSPDIDRAAAFIATEFKKAGLQPLKGNSFLQEFHLQRPGVKTIKAIIDGSMLPSSNVMIASQQPKLTVDEKSGYGLETIKAGENFRNRVQELAAGGKNLLVFVDTSFARSFPRLSGFTTQPFTSDEKNESSIVFILGQYQPSTFRIDMEQTILDTKYTNVVGILPGRSKKNEYVIFSGHYDHLGIAREPVKGDSIYNGANDDAAGTTAVIVLGKYFKKQHNNERTLVFAAFTAEEIGGYGSRYFSKQFDPKQVMAMFNIEMIGTESKWGENSAYITGFEKTNMGELMQKNLEGSSFSFHPDPYTTENLFYRSDNATLARLGVPAHTISTAKMDGEPNYHKLSDEVSTLDMKNMTAIIRAIALSAKSLVSGNDTPTRVAPESLR
jgi:hypothetical protein